nr:amidase [Deltaproteobacteria bacterium]
MLYGGPALAENDDSRLVFLTARQLAKKIRLGETTSAEVVQAFLNQIGTYNPTLNAIVTLDTQGALERAREADEALARGELWGPLHGVPVTIKDAFATAGMRSTSSYPPLANYIPEEDATVVARLRAAGAIILGKSNLPELAGDFQTNSPVFGITSNPWDITRTPGGSSGGSAAAVAAGLSPLEIGSDLAGSIRIPAHFCGIYAMKPTEHLVSGFGHFSGLEGVKSYRNLSSPGPLARSIDDLILCLSIMAGPDNRDVDVPKVTLHAVPAPALQELRIAWTDNFGNVPITEETRKTLQALADRLVQLGCHVEKLNPPNFDFEIAWKTYGEISGMQDGVNMPALFRQFTYVVTQEQFKDVPTLQLYYAPMTVEKYFIAMAQRDALIASLESFLAEWDAWLCPVSSTPAFQHLSPSFYSGSHPVYTAPLYVDSQPLDYLVANMSYTTIFNLTGSPVVTIPAGATSEGLPIGIQVVGRRWYDMKLLAVADKIADVADAFKNPPGY